MVQCQTKSYGPLLLQCTLDTGHTGDHRFADGHSEPWIRPDDQGDKSTAYTPKERSKK